MINKKKQVFFSKPKQRMSKNTKVWLDCDPGIDDAFAIILTAFHDSLDLIGISTVAGNQILDKITHNTLQVVIILMVVLLSY